MKLSEQLKLPVYQPLPARAGVDLSSRIGFGLQILFLSCMFFTFLLGQSPAWKNTIGNVSINFIAVLIEALPFMLVGTLAGGIIEVFVPTAWVDRVFGVRRVRAVFLAGGMGLLFPTCECAIVPVVRRLLGKGVPFAAAITFMLAGPIVNVIVAWSTATAYTYNWNVVVMRLACGYAIAVFVGLVLGRFFNRENGVVAGLSLSPQLSCGCAGHDQDRQPWHRRVGHAIGHARDDFFEVGRYLVVGAFIAALMRSFVSIDVFTRLMETPWLAIVLMMVMAVLLNLCSEADAFIAASFRWLLPGSAQMGFMVLGPMLDLKLILMYFSVFRRRVIVFLCLTVCVTVFVVMLAIEHLLPAFI